MAVFLADLAFTTAFFTVFVTAFLATGFTAFFTVFFMGFLAGLREHLTPQGEGWLILSDLAEHLNLRSRDELLDWITQAGLQVLGRHDIRPRHGKVMDTSDPLHAARSQEITSLWRLGNAA